MKPILNKYTKKPARIEDFYAIVPWVYIEEKLYSKDYKRFLKWMEGQTTPYLGGVYRWDFERFLEGADSFR